MFLYAWRSLCQIVWLKSFSVFLLWLAIFYNFNEERCLSPNNRIRTSTKNEVIDDSGFWCLEIKWLSAFVYTSQLPCYIIISLCLGMFAILQFCDPIGHQTHCGICCRGSKSIVVPFDHFCSQNPTRLISWSLNSALDVLIFHPLKKSWNAWDFLKDLHFIRGRLSERTSTFLGMIHDGISII